MLVRLEMDDFAEGLLTTYENAAMKAGLAVNDKSRYDCRHICVAENVQDEWIRYYKNWLEEKHPAMSEADVMANVMSLLLMSGAKVDHSLGKNEITIEDGFLTND